MQLNLFDLTEQDVFENCVLFFEEKKPLRTLKREVKRKIVDPNEIELKLKEKLGTLYLHRLKKLKELSDRYDYQEYLLGRIYKVYFEETVSKITKDSFEECFKIIEETLSDEFVTVTLERETGLHTHMVKGIAFYIKLSSSEGSIAYLTGSEFKSKKKHLSSRYFVGYGKESARILADISLILPELLLQKEARHFFTQPDNAEMYLKLLRDRFISNKTIKLDVEIEKNYPVIMDSLNEEIAIGGFTTSEYNDVDVRKGILGFYGHIMPLGIEMLYNVTSFYKHGRSYIGRIFVWEMIKDVVPRISEIDYHVKSLRKSSSDYAATYVEKKNIPDKTLEKMKNSKLLKHFYNVEYDELVELASVDQFENEILSFINTFGVPVPKNASFKVRRLGKLKAAGVFYPFFNTLAVDVNHPNSFIHEYWHMVDYYMKDNGDDFTGQRLSSRRDFEPIVKEYKRLVSKHMDELPEKSMMKALFNGTTKYNKDYYFETTEIFARCAEIHFVNALNGKSSLVDDENQSCYYPKDENFRMMINNYFNNLLKEVCHETTNAA